MTQMDSPFNEPQFQQQYATSGGPDRPTSGLAITALIFSLIICCPLTTLLGVLLGLFAVFATGPTSEKKGRGLAIAAVLIGLIMTALWTVLIYIFITQMVIPSMQAVERGPSQVITASMQGDYDSVRANMFGAGANASDAEIEVFAETLRSRYGNFASASPQPAQPDPDMQAPEQVFAYDLRFDNATLAGETVIVFSDPNGQTMFVFKPRRIVVQDPDLGDVVFPQGTP